MQLCRLMSNFESNLSKFTIYFRHVYFSICTMIDATQFQLSTGFYLSSCCRCIDLLQDSSCMSLDVTSQSCSSTVMPRTNTSYVGAVAWHKCAVYYLRSSIRFFSAELRRMQTLPLLQALRKNLTCHLLGATIRFSEPEFKKTVKDGTRTQEMFLNKKEENRYLNVLGQMLSSVWNTNKARMISLYMLFAWT